MSRPTDVHRPLPHPLAGTVPGHGPWAIPSEVRGRQIYLDPMSRPNVACGRLKGEVWWTIDPDLVTCRRCRKACR